MLGVRLDPSEEMNLSDLARRTGRTKSEIARLAISQYIRANDERYLAECRRQSQLASKMDSKEDLLYLQQLADDLAESV